MTQTERVLRLLRRRGQYGITQVDFQPPLVADFGPPITRVAARIDDLKKDGAVIVTRGRRKKCMVYALASAFEETPELPPATDGLQGPPAPGSPQAAEQQLTFGEAA